MSEAPAKKSSIDIEQLEARIATLESTLSRVVAFDQTVSQALTNVLSGLAMLEPAVGVAASFDRKFENYRSVQNLGQTSRMYPKTRSVMFVGKGFFGDNAKYVYLAFCEYARRHDIAVHFLTDDQSQLELMRANGLPCLSAVPEQWSAEDAKKLLSAKVVVINDNFHPYCMRSTKPYSMLQGAKSIQLWHGIPIKEIGLQYLLRTDNVLLEDLLASSGIFDVFVAPGKADKDEWAQMFAFRDYAPLGYARNDVFFRTPTAHDLLNVDTETLRMFEQARKANQPTILYAPTFRVDPASGWFDKIDIVAIANHARNKGYCFAVNLHPLEQNKIAEFREIYRGVPFVAAGTDIYPIAAQTDIMITDYSSLVFDYLLLDRPAIFYQPDHEYYIKNSRSLIPGRAELTPGAVALNSAELIRAIEDAAGFVRDPRSDKFRKVRHDLRARFFDHVDGNSAQRVCELIAKYVDAK